MVETVFISMGGMELGFFSYLLAAPKDRKSAEFSTLITHLKLAARASARRASLGSGSAQSTWLMPGHSILKTRSHSFLIWKIEMRIFLLPSGGQMSQSMLIVSQLCFGGLGRQL